MATDEQNRIIQEAAEVIALNQTRNQEWEMGEKMFHVEWDLPAGVPQHTRKVVSLEPANAVTAATNTLAAITPSWKIQPLGNKDEDRNRADLYEQALKWFWMRGSKRGQGTALRDIVHNVMLYDLAAVEVVAVEHELKQAKANEVAASHLKRAQRRGPFAYVVHNPKSVHPIFDTWGLKAVVVDKTMPAHEVCSNYGTRAKDLDTWIDGDPERSHQDVRVLEYRDSMKRMVWVNTDPAAQISTTNIDSPVGSVPMAGGTQKSSKPTPNDGRATFVLIAPDEKVELDFLPWAIATGGSNQGRKPEDKYQPLLIKLIRSKDWDNFNVLRSIAFSDTLRTLLQPKAKKTSITREAAEDIQPDYESYGHEIALSNNEDYQRLPSIPLDSRALQLAQEFRQVVEESTVSKRLQGGAAVPGEAFAATNLQVANALSAISRFKETVETVLGFIAELHFEWIKFLGKPVYAAGITRINNGEQIVINPDELDPASLYITAEVTPDEPTDRLQRTQAAQLQLSAEMISKRYAQEQIGVDNASAMNKEIEREKLERAVFDLQIQLMAAQQQLALQQEAQAAQMQAQQEAQAQAQAAQQQQALNQSMAPNQGGNPAALFDPAGVTREQVSGVDRAGNEVPF